MSLKHFVERHPVPSYFTLVYLITWGAILLIVRGLDSSGGTDPTVRTAIVSLPLLVAPGLVGITLTAFLEGKAGIRAMFSRMTHWRVGMGDDLHILSSQSINKSMKTFLRLEEIALVILSFYLFLALDYIWWWFPIFFFVPDVSLLGYLINQKLGANIYNVVHQKALAILVCLLGSFTHIAMLQLAGVVMFGHSSFDRALGFELQQSISKGK